MYMDSEKFENWMERIMERFDRTEKLLERVLKKSNALDGEEVLDNQDLCLLLKVGKRKGAGKKACFRKSDISFMISVSGRGLAGS